MALERRGEQCHEYSLSLEQDEEEKEECDPHDLPLKDNRRQRTSVAVADTLL